MKSWKRFAESGWAVWRGQVEYTEKRAHASAVAGKLWRDRVARKILFWILEFGFWIVEEKDAIRT